MHQWQTLKLFLSSTFKDLELQRDELSRIFGHIKDSLRDRQLFFSPYDLRWKHRHGDHDVVKWCLEMLDQCQYFIGILGYRYGWRPDHLRDGQPNEQRYSITEMEMQSSIEKIEPHRRLYLLGNLSQYSQEEMEKEREEDRASVETLKQWLRDRGENCIEFGSTEELLSLIERELPKIFDSDYPPGVKVPLVEHTRKDALREILEEKRKGFVGRSVYLQKLQDFASSNSEKNYLCLQARAGTGKSALLAEVLHTFSAAHPETPYIAHYMSMGLDSRTVDGVMQSLGEQLKEKGLVEGDLELDPIELRGQVRRTLEQVQNPLVVALDGLDEMEKSGKSLSWLPRFLPAHVRVILTIRPVDPFDELQKISPLETLELPPLEKEEILQIIEDYQNTQELSLSEQDRNLLFERSAGNPLFLKVALDEILSTGMAVGHLATGVEGLFKQIFDRLSKAHGEQLLWDYLGLIAAGRDGVSEEEIKEVLEAITDDLLLSLEKGLANFIIHRQGLLAFFHPEFERTIMQQLGKGGMRGYHRRLAVYFRLRGFSYQRTLRELAYQLLWAEARDKVLELLTNIDFLQTKSTADMIDDLKADYDRALEDMVVKLPESASAVVYGDIGVSRETLRLIRKAIGLDQDFLRRRGDHLFQCLWNRLYWHDSPECEKHYEVEEGDVPVWKKEGNKIYLLAEKWRGWWEKEGKIWIKSHRPLPERIDSPILKILREHEGAAYSLAYHPDGSRLASGDCKTVRIWDSESGKCLKTLSGHIARTVADWSLPLEVMYASGT